MEFFNYMLENKDQIISLCIEHIELTAIALIIAIIIGVPIGILISYKKKLNKPILGVTSVTQAIPSMALLGFMIPFLGIGTAPAIVVVVLYSLLPIIKNTYTGITNISPATIEAATGIGLTRAQILTKIQIPQALPIIMAGVRISSVSAVGLMTMAAFIGGGGLGYLIFSGIRTVNNYQILAGAIPACILALLVDYFFGAIEKLVTPLSLQSDKNHQENIKKSQRKNKIIVIGTIILIAFLFLHEIDFSKKSGDVIRVGSKDFTEQEILCYMTSHAIENNTDINVEEECNLGGAQVVFSALTNNNIDLYIDYAGTDYTDILKHKPISDVDKVYKTIKEEMKEKYNVEVLNQMAFNNTYALAVTKETAEKYNLKTISDLTRVANDFIIAPTLEFINREDGLPGLEKEYGLNFKDTIGIDGSPRYTALQNNNAQVIDAFTTDGLLKKFNLTVLEDDKNFFPPYYAIPLVRSDTLKEYPEIEKILNALGPYLTDEVMQDLNYQVDELGKSPEKVATDFLNMINLTV
ncbi:MAG: glycine betaine ABC transporter substrate-binding protein [Candidatus Faecimonas sp.]|nr:ABC transporter permease subunit [Mycoplasmatota bacterium]MDY2907572.1 glycine betaine ABC transporter substrate-binding protein [Candidatus Faecimonas sp.]